MTIVAESGPGTGEDGMMISRDGRGDGHEATTPISRVDDDAPRMPRRGLPPVRGARNALKTQIMHLSAE